MIHKKLFPYLLWLAIFIMACNFGGLLTPGETETPPTIIPPTEADETAPVGQQSKAEICKRRWIDSAGRNVKKTGLHL